MVLDFCRGKDDTVLMTNSKITQFRTTTSVTANYATSLLQSEGYSVTVLPSTDEYGCPVLTVSIVTSADAAGDDRLAAMVALLEGAGMTGDTLSVLV